MTLTMSLPWQYQFVTLSAEEIADRRKILDRNGFYSYLTPIAILAAIASYQKVTSRLRSQSSDRSEKGGVLSPTRSQIRLRRLQWWLSTPLNPEFGSIRVHLIGLIYAIWLLFLTFRQTSNDYLHLTKRIGHIAVCQLPLHYLLAIKSPRSPVQSITSLSHETLLPYHRLFGRIIHLFLTAHATLYMNFFFQVNLLPSRLSAWNVRLGILAIFLFQIIAITTLPPIRKYAYHAIFYRSHVFLSLAILPVLFFHVPYTRNYIIQCFILALFNGASRKFSTSVPILSHVKPIPSTNLFRLVVPGPAWGVPPLMGSRTPGWIPGQHCYVKQSHSPSLPKSPFTIVSLPPTKGPGSEDESSKLELVIRDLGGPTTGWLGRKPKETGVESLNVSVMIEGPYGEAAAYVPGLLETQDQGSDVLFIAGGVGATFILPIYLSLLHEIARDIRSAKKKTPPITDSMTSSDRKITFIWIVKSRSEMNWGIDMMKRAGLDGMKENLGVDIDIRIFITRSGDQSTSGGGGGVGNHTSGQKGTSSTPSNDIQFPGLVISDLSTRPDVNALVTEMFGCTPPPPPSLVSPSDKSADGGQKYRYEKVTVLICGPRGLAGEVRREVGRHVLGYGREVVMHEEVFGHG